MTLCGELAYGSTALPSWTNGELKLNSLREVMSLGRGGSGGMSGGLSSGARSTNGSTGARGGTLTKVGDLSAVVAPTWSGLSQLQNADGCCVLVGVDGSEQLSVDVDSPLIERAVSGDITGNEPWPEYAHHDLLLSSNRSFVVRFAMSSA